jgi:hypothetical protein
MSKKIWCETRASVCVMCARAMHSPWKNRMGSCWMLRLKLMRIAMVKTSSLRQCCETQTSRQQHQHRPLRYPRCTKGEEGRLPAPHSHEASWIRSRNPFCSARASLPLLCFQPVLKKGASPQSRRDLHPTLTYHHLASGSSLSSWLSQSPQPGSLQRRAKLKKNDKGVCFRTPTVHLQFFFQGMTSWCSDELSLKGLVFVSDVCLPLSVRKNSRRL